MIEKNAAILAHQRVNMDRSMWSNYGKKKKRSSFLSEDKIPVEMPKTLYNFFPVKHLLEYSMQLWQELWDLSYKWVVIMKIRFFL